MQANGVVVLLTAEPRTVLGRVQGDNGRPILNGNMNEAYIRQLLAGRMPYYQAAAELEEATDNLSPAEIAREIQKKLNSGKICFDF